MVKLSPLARGIGLWSGYVVEVSDDDNDDNDSNGDFAGQWASDNKAGTTIPPPHLSIDQLPFAEKQPRAGEKDNSNGIKKREARKIIPSQTLMTRSGAMMLYVPTVAKPIKRRKDHIYAPGDHGHDQSKGEAYYARLDYSREEDALRRKEQRERYKKWESYNEKLRAPRFLFACAMEVKDKGDIQEFQGKKAERCCRRFASHFQGQVADIASLSFDRDKKRTDYSAKLHTEDSYFTDDKFSTMASRGTTADNFNRQLPDARLANQTMPKQLKLANHGTALDRVISKNKQDNESNEIPEEDGDKERVPTKDGDAANNPELNNNDEQPWLDDDYIYSREDFNHSDPFSETPLNHSFPNHSSLDFHHTMSSRILAAMDKDGIVRSQSCVNPIQNSSPFNRSSRSAIGRTEGNVTISAAPIRESVSLSPVNEVQLETPDSTPNSGRNINLNKLRSVSPNDDINVLSPSFQVQLNGHYAHLDAEKRVSPVLKQNSHLSIHLPKENSFQEGNKNGQNNKQTGSTAIASGEDNQTKLSVTWKDSDDKRKDAEELEAVFQAIRKLNRSDYINGDKKSAGAIVTATALPEETQEESNSRITSALGKSDPKKATKKGKRKDSKPPLLIQPLTTNKRPKKRSKKGTKEVAQMSKEDEERIDGNNQEDDVIAKSQDTISRLSKAMTEMDLKTQAVIEESQFVELEIKYAKQAEEEARQMITEQRAAVRRERERSRLELQEKRRQEREMQRLEEKRKEDEAKQRELEFRLIMADEEEKQRLEEEERERIEEQKRQEEERREEEEENAQIEMEEAEKKLAEEERQAEAEAIANIVRLRQEAEERHRRLLEEEQIFKEQLEQERLALEEEQRRYDQEMAERELRAQRRREEEERFRMEIKRQQDEVRQQELAEMRRQYEEIMKRYKQDLENRANLKTLTYGQEFTKPWVFSYLVLWPRGSYERLMGTEKGYSVIQKRTNDFLKTKNGIYKV